MKGAIIYYSKTGNTEMIAKQFVDFNLLKVQAQSDDPNILDPVLTVIPEVNDYERLIFASPVHGFQLAKIMVKYLNQIDNLEGKIIDIFVTHHFRFAFLGGKQSLNQMRKVIESKGGKVRYLTSINWKSKLRENDIFTLVEKYSV